MRSVITILMLISVLVGSVGIAGAEEPHRPTDIKGLKTSIYVLFGVVLIGMPLYSALIGKFFTNGKKAVGLRALNLPNGSIRAMLGLLTVGSFVLVLVYGLSLPYGSSPFFDQIITAFGTLAGSVTGFYFAGRVASPPPPKQD